MLSAGLVEAGQPDGAYVELRAALCLAGAGDRTPEQALERARRGLRGADQRTDAEG
jgi:hypothetical protein